MTLRLEQVVPELRAVIKGFAQQADSARSGLERAEAAFNRWALAPAEGDAEIVRKMADDPRPFALSSSESLDAVHAAPPPGPATVVAADGSSIAPDRFAPVPCYVINTGFVSLPYAVPGHAILNAEASVGPRSLLVASEDDGSEATDARGLGVELLRDVAELERAEDLAAHAAGNGPVVVLLDGTLLPWDLDARHVAENVRASALERTNGALARIRDLGPGVSLGAYVSMTRAGEVMTSLAALTGTASMPAGDAGIFGRRLSDGERSALFRSQSRRGQRVEKLLSDHAVMFFYVRVGSDIARVELPQWAASEAQVRRLHATLIDQCQRCSGYPRALQEAHEQAVISGADRAAFARLLEREVLAGGLGPAAGGKAESKRRRAV